MPAGAVATPQVDLDQLGESATALPSSSDLAFRTIFSNSQLWPKVGGFLQGHPENVAAAFGGTGSDVSLSDTPRLNSEQANDRYGIPGVLRFNGDIDESEAAFQNAQARRRQFTTAVLGNTVPDPLGHIGAAVAGSIFDPVGLPLMLLGGPLGDAAKAGLSADAIETGLQVAKIGRVANTALDVAGTVAEGAASNLPFVAANYGLSQYANDPYTAGDALRDLATGVVLHGANHLLGASMGALADRIRPEGDVASGALDTAPPTDFTPYTPPEVMDLPDRSRAGAFLKATDDLTGDEPVDVGQYVARERDPDPTALQRLDEPTAEPQIDGRWGDDGTAVTTRGTEVPVRYGLVELGDLTTSHSDDLQPNPAFPPELQPRDRARAGAMARNYQLEQELNPKLLMGDVNAAGGAPMVAPDGVVESGNGRTIALRRSAAKGGDAYAAYRAELEAQGYDTTGMQSPALVRMRTQPMEGAQRAALAREMNADVTERMSATEQAMSDARRMDDGDLALAGGDRGLGDPAFARGFLSRVAPDQTNALVAPDGAVSHEGVRRIKAAVLARAYEDRGIVGQIHEGEETSTRKLAEALASAAPSWARMRALAARGDIPRELDLTANLRSALDLVRHARAERLDLGALLAERLGQTDMFSGSAIAAETEAFLRMMFRDEKLSKPTPAEKLSAALRDYARQASEVTPGPDLFGDTAGEDTARQILSNAADRYARADAGDLDQRAPGRVEAKPAGDAARPAVLDLGQPRDERAAERPDGEQDAPRGGDNAERPGDAAGAAAGGAKPVIYGSGQLRQRLDGEFGGDSGKLAAAIRQEVSDTLATGGRVDIVAEGKARPIVSVDALGMKDAKGNPWGILPLMMQAAGDDDRLELHPTERGEATSRPTSSRPSAERIIAGDPELKALSDANAAFAATHGLEDAAAPADREPTTLAEALRAAAVCLIGELG